MTIHNLIFYILTVLFIGITFYDTLKLYREIEK